MSSRSDASETAAARATAAARTRLLAQQRAILAHLANPDAYEQTATPAPEAPDPALAGLDLDRLRLIGGFIHAKRMSKIEGLLPATCRCVATHVPALLRAFAAACPPTSLGRPDNARQLHDFVLAYEGPPPAPSYLADLVRLEQLASAATFAARDRPPPAAMQLDPRWGAFEVRVQPELQMFETEYDLRPAFDDHPPATLPRGRLRRVAVVSGTNGARVFWLEDEIAALLLDIGEWTLVRAEGRTGVRSVLEPLVARGLVEVRPCDYA